MARKTKATPDTAPQGAFVESYKGFDKDLACRGFQFEVGKTYTVSGKIEACANPMDVWTYYGLGEGNRFALVEQSGALDRHDQDSKIASASITIKAELSLPEFIKRAVAWVIDATKGADSGLTDKGGDSAQIGSSGHSAKIGSSGHSAQIGSSGHSAKIGSSGYSAQIGSSGDSAKIGSSGYSAQIGSSGHSAKIGSSGDSAKIGSSGDSAKIGSSGYSAQIGSSGDSAKIGSSGDYAKIETEGENAVIASAGAFTRVKGKAGAHVALAEYRAGKCIGFATGCIGSDGLPADTWLVARDGKLVVDGAA